MISAFSFFVFLLEFLLREQKATKDQFLRTPLICLIITSPTRCVPSSSSGDLCFFLFRFSFGVSSTRTKSNERSISENPLIRLIIKSLPGFYKTKRFCNKMLGITINNKLKFDNHVAKICRKVSQQIAVLKRIKKMLPFETRRDLYLAFILPHFNYCSETWNFCSKSAADKLERLNERAIRFVFRDKYTSYSELLNALGLSSLKQQRLIKITLSIFNAVHNSLAPKSIQDLIVHRKNVSYNLRGDYILSLPKPKSTTYGLNSVRYIGPKLWNSIPNMFRNITNFKSLKRSISQVDLVQFLWFRRFFIELSIYLDIRYTY